MKAVKKNELYTIDETVEKSGISHTTVSAYSRRLGVAKIGGVRYFSEKDIEKMVSSYRRKNRRPLDITGRVINYLTAIKCTGRKEPTAHGGQSYVWVWRCVCGNTIEANVADITSKKLQSCGCKKTEYNKKNIEVIRQIPLYKDTNIATISRETLQKNNTSGVTGVWKVKREKEIKYGARIGFKKRSIHLGVFGTIEQATKARELAEKKYFEPIIKEYWSVRKMKSIREEIQKEVEESDLNTY